MKQEQGPTSWGFYRLLRGRRHLGTSEGLGAVERSDNPDVQSIAPRPPASHCLAAAHLEVKIHLQRVTGVEFLKSTATQGC